jgi:hypothetical protein
MLALLRLTEFTTKPDELASTTVVVAIGELAKVGSPAEALEQLELICHRLLPDAASELSRMLMTGAEIALKANDLSRMEDYLQRALDLHKRLTRKTDRRRQEKDVRWFRTRHGLLAPSDATAEEHTDVSFKYLVRQASQAMDRGDATGSVAKLLEAEALVALLPKSRHSGAIQRLVMGFHLAGDQANLLRLLDQDAAADSKMRLMPKTLLKVGQRSRAIARYEDEAREALEKLQTETLNAHFPAGQLERAIIGLADAGEMELARKWLSPALAEGESWQLLSSGAFSSAVFRSVANAVARVNGNEAALSLLQIATERANKDRKSGWRTQAIQDNAELLIELSPPDQAAEIARKLRARTTKLRVQAKLFAQQQDWDALHEVLNSCKTPMEAAETIWWTKFVWRPATG